MASNWVLRILLASILLLAMALSALGQSGNEGSVEGVVTDPTGAVVPEATLQITQFQTSARFSTQSNAAGYFWFPAVPVGTYRLETKHAGFATLVVNQIEVRVGEHVTVPVSLHLAGDVQSITVQAEPQPFDRARSEVSSVLDNRTLTELPVNGRDFISFTLLTPGVTQDVRGGLSFAGQRAMNSVLLDGANYDDPFWNQAIGGEGFASPGTQGLYAVSLETVQEYQVNSNAYSAEFGRAAGGVINVVTKSGGNQFHGSGFWFYRDKSLNANNFLNNANGLPKDPYHFNQAGGVLSGPIRKDRLFFLVSYDALRSNSTNTVILGLPPDFNKSSDPVVAAYQQRALDYLVPRASSWDLPLIQNNFMAKIDWSASSSHLLSARWNHSRYSVLGFGGPQLASEGSVPSPGNTDLLTLSLSSTFHPSLVNSAHASFWRGWYAFQAASINPEAFVLEGGQLVLDLGRCECAPQEWSNYRGQWSDTVSYIHRNHALRLGADAMQDWIRYFQATRFSGFYVFRSLESFGRSLAGTPMPLVGDEYLQAFSGFGVPGVSTHPNVFQFAGFAQDEWRVRRNLTLNLGLRYDVESITKPPVKNPSPALTSAGLDTSSLRTDNNNIAPRIGFAWAPRGSDHLVIRGGYGIYYAMTPSIVTSRADYLNGITVQSRAFFGGSPGAELIPSYPNTICGPPDPSGTPPSCAPPPVGATTPAIALFSPDHREGYAQQWSLGFEIRLAQNMALSASYLGVKGTHLLRSRDINLTIPETTERIGIAGTTTVLTFREFTRPRPIAGFDRVLLYESSANSIYHGLAIQLNKRFSHNFQLLGSYTWSKVIDDNPNQYAVQPGGADPEFLSDSSNPLADRSAGVNDQRHRFALSGIWQLAYANRLPRASRMIFGGWETSGVLVAQTGQPYSGYVDFDLNNDGNAATDRTPGLGRNTFYLPGGVTLDARLARDVPLKEHIQLQLICEAFNVFNHTNVADVQGTQHSYSSDPVACGIARTPCLVPVKDFGVPLAYLPARIMQLAVRLTF
ncbi:MAG TPA: TonB-dependent receptor [Terriglobia bacterium]|nr:TonB-dependent receptor [Terriglobia bacterium]